MEWYLDRSLRDKYEDALLFLYFSVFFVCSIFMGNDRMIFVSNFTW